jgi:hypothetical protein
MPTADRDAFCPLPPWPCSVTWTYSLQLHHLEPRASSVNVAGQYGRQCYTKNEMLWLRSENVATVTICWPELVMWPLPRASGPGICNPHACLEGEENQI